MDILAALISVVSQPVLMGWILLAAVVGMIAGAIPGLTAAAAIAMLLPLTYYMDPLAALAFLYVIGKSGRYGGSIAAILFNTPGTAASAATQIDGYPLARDGMATKAMRVATISSVIGDYIGDILLIIGIAWIAALALKMGPPELFAVYTAAFIVIGSVIGRSVWRGLASGVLGMLVSLIGYDPISGVPRFTFSTFELTNGVGLVPLMIGIFVMGEVLHQLDMRRVLATQAMANLSVGDDAERNRLTWMEYKPCIPHVVRSSFIGAFIGMLPGLGSAIAAFVAYGEGKRRAQNASEWGHGALEGVAAPEAANNAVSGPSMAPLLTLGIPGSTIGAVLMGVFVIHGIQIGPTLFITSRDLIYGLFASGLIGIAAYGLIGYFGAAHIGRLLAQIPANVLYPVVFLTCFVAAYTTRGSLFDVWVMLAAGVLGWLMRKTDLSPAAFVISFVLAPGAEEAFRQSLLLSDAGALIFLQRPICLAILATGLAVLAWRAFHRAVERRKTSGEIGHAG